MKFKDDAGCRVKPCRPMCRGRTVLNSCMSIETDSSPVNVYDCCRRVHCTVYTVHAYNNLSTQQRCNYFLYVTLFFPRIQYLSLSRSRLFWAKAKLEEKTRSLPSKLSKKLDSSRPNGYIYILFNSSNER